MSLRISSKLGCCSAGTATRGSRSLTASLASLQNIVHRFARRSTGNWFIMLTASICQGRRKSA